MEGQTQQMPRLDREVGVMAGSTALPRMARKIKYSLLRRPPGNNSSATRPDALAAGPHRCFRRDLVRGGGVGCRGLGAGVLGGNGPRIGKRHSAGTLLRTG